MRNKNSCIVVCLAIAALCVAWCMLHLHCTQPVPADDFSVILAALEKGQSIFLGSHSTERLRPAWRAVSTANALAYSGNSEAAIQQWQDISERYSKTDPTAAVAALWNIATVLKDQGDEPNTVLRLKELLDVNVSKNAYCNPQHYACRDLADIYIRQGRLEMALHYAVLAKEKHLYHDAFCGTCEDIERHNVSVKAEKIRHQYEASLKISEGK